MSKELDNLLNEAEQTIHAMFARSGEWFEQYWKDNPLYRPSFDDPAFPNLEQPLKMAFIGRPNVRGWCWCDESLYNEDGMLGLPVGPSICYNDAQAHNLAALEDCLVNHGGRFEKSWEGQYEWWSYHWPDEVIRDKNRATAAMLAAIRLKEKSK